MNTIQKRLLSVVVLAIIAVLCFRTRTPEPPAAPPPFSAGPVHRPVVSREAALAIMDGLPSVRAAVYAQTRAMRESAPVPGIREGLRRIQKVLLPSLVRLESALEQVPVEEAQARVTRDLEALARDAEIRGHELGWGGSAVQLNREDVILDHVERRIRHDVWMLAGRDDQTAFDRWSHRWEPFHAPSIPVSIKPLPSFFPTPTAIQASNTPLPPLP